MISKSQNFRSTYVTPIKAIQLWIYKMQAAFGTVANLRQSLWYWALKLFILRKLKNIVNVYGSYQVIYRVMCYDILQMHLTYSALSSIKSCVEYS